MAGKRGLIEGVLTLSLMAAVMFIANVITGMIRINTVSVVLATGVVVLLWITGTKHLRAIRANRGSTHLPRQVLGIDVEEWYKQIFNDTSVRSIVTLATMPIAYEVIFRGIIMQSLAGLIGPIPALVIQAMLATIFPSIYMWQYWKRYFIISLISGVLVLISNSLLPSIAFSVTNELMFVLLIRELYRNRVAADNKERTSSTIIIVIKKNARQHEKESHEVPEMWTVRFIPTCIHQSFVTTVCDNALNVTYAR